VTSAAVRNEGQLRAESVSMSDNLLNDLIGTVELQAVMNLGSGTVSGRLGSPR
jgi:hypothetical protein